MSKDTWNIHLKSGPISIVVSNIVAAITLLGLRNLGASPHSSILLLAVGNLACALLVFFPKVTGSPVLPRSFQADFGIILWALCYSFNYGLFVLYPNSISLSDLIIAQSFAPTFAVLITGDWKNVKSKYKTLLENFGGLSILIFLAYTKRSSSIGPNSRTGSNLPVIISMCCFLGTNIAARWVTKEGPPLWGQSRVAFLNGFLLLFGFLFFGDATSQINISFHILGGLGIGAGVLITQGLFLRGLARTPPFLAALFLSTSVPISIAMEAIFQIRRLVPLEIGLSIFYCLFVGLASYRQIINLSAKKYYIQEYSISK